MKVIISLSHWERAGVRALAEQKRTTPWLFSVLRFVPVGGTKIVMASSAKPSP
jgi:hypothetical protein